jgi:hypothetical protein
VTKKGIAQSGALFVFENKRAAGEVLPAGHFACCPCRW